MNRHLRSTRAMPRPATRITRSACRSLAGCVLALAAVACSDLTGVDQAGSPPLTEQVAPSAAVTAAGVTYYVSPNGRDNRAGTSPATAWKTLRKVNGKAFGPGDRILFEGGAVFAGTLAFTASSRGTAAAPIVVGSYGTGRATINGGNGIAIRIYNTSGFEIRNLVVVGSGRTTNTASGVSVYTDLAGGIKLPYIRIDNVEASGFGKFGIVVGSWNNLSGFSDVRITYSTSHDNGRAGVSSYAQLPYAHQDFYYGHLLSYNNSGVPGLTTNSGSGLTMGGVTRGMIERSVAHNNGWLCDASEGPVGIWTYDSDGVVIQHNESHHNRTNGPADGGGFDLDQNTRNAVVQYNYSHENDGPGFLLSHAPNTTDHAGNTVRYNVSQNDGRRNATAGIVVWGRTIGAEIHNNSVYVRPSSTGTPRAVNVHNSGIPTQDVKNLHIRNNVFFADGGVTALWVSADQLNGAIDLRFEGNNYFGGATQPRFLWAGTTYTGLGTWRTATGQELLGGVALGSQTDPGFAAAGAGGTIGNADLLSTLTAYQLKATSSLIDKGLDLKQRFGVNPGVVDFYSGSTPWALGYDVGAHERH